MDSQYSQKNTNQEDLFENEEHSSVQKQGSSERTDDSTRTDEQKQSSSVQKEDSSEQKQDSSEQKQDSSEKEEDSKRQELIPKKRSFVRIDIPVVNPLRASCTTLGLQGTNISGPICRICFGTSSVGKLISPCECKGSIGFVHKVCLEHWLGTKNTDKCELCNYQFATYRTRKRLWDWCVDPSTRTDRKNFLGDLLCFLFLTPLGAASFYLCIRGAYYFYTFEKGVLEATSLVGLAAFLAFAYITWLVLSAKYHYAAWKHYRMRSWNVKILIPDDSDESLHLHDQDKNDSNSIGQNLSRLSRHQPPNKDSSAPDSNRNQNDADIEIIIHTPRSQSINVPLQM